MKHFASSSDDSTSESMSDFVGYSETGSAFESVGSVEIESSQPKARSNRNEWTNRMSRPAKKGAHENLGTQFMHFVKELRDVPVAAAWAFVRDHQVLATLVPGIVDSFHQLEGQGGGAGTVYLASYNSSWVKSGDDKYLINKVEVSDDDSKLYAVRRLGGQHHAWFQVYIAYIQVLADDILGDKSSVIVWRLESQRRNLKSRPSGNCPPLDDARRSYMIVTDRIKERYLTMNRVDRPIVVDPAAAVNMPKRLKLRLQTGQQLLTGPDDDPEPGDSSQQRRRKSRIVKNDDGSDRESKTRWRPRRTKGRLSSA